MGRTDGRSTALSVLACPSLYWSVLDRGNSRRIHSSPSQSVGNVTSAHRRFSIPPTRNKEKNPINDAHPTPTDCGLDIFFSAWMRVIISRVTGCFRFARLFRRVLLSNWTYRRHPAKNTASIQGDARSGRLIFPSNRTECIG